MKNKIAQFQIDYLQFVDKTGNIVSELPSFAYDTNIVINMYRMMVQTRLFDAKAVALQRTGKIGTYPSVLGQEAIGIGIGASMKKTDVLCPYYRECGAQFWRGVTMEELLIYWGGCEDGSNFSGPKEDFPICIPIASQTLHAVGVATAMKLRKQTRAALASIGDGGTSRGDFYEAVNVAGAWQLPVVFVVNNNQWAISVPRLKQTSSETIAQKAFAGGVYGIQVDGNDVIAVRQVISEALEKAYSGNGASVIEAITYRMCDHTTADDARRYRSETELNDYEAKDPIERVKQFLLKYHNWNEEQDKALKKTSMLAVNMSVEAYLVRAKRPVESMFTHLYETLPYSYERQRQEVLALGREN